MYFQFVDKSAEYFCGADKLYEITESNDSYGFLTEKNRNANERLQIPELNDGFQEIFWYNKQEITKLKADVNGVYVDYEGQGELPLTFVCDVPQEGNYEVHVTIVATENVKDAMIFTGRRRLAYIGDLQEGDILSEDFLTNICPIIARGSADVSEDLTCDVTIIGKGLRLMDISVEKSDVRTLYIAGDSTVTDQTAAYPYLPGRSYCGWGQMISYFVNDQMAVSNHAHSGLTTESFRSENHYDILIERIKEDDICLFQFGHNDQKLMHLMAEGGYRERLTAYVNEIKEKGAIPVIISPLARNSWKANGEDIEYNDLLAPYSAECARLAKELDVPYVELHDRAMEFVLKLGRDKAKSYFFPSDYTHSDDYGAFLFASFVYAGLAKVGLMEEKELDIWTAPEEIEELIVPEEYRSVRNADEAELLADIERPEDNLTRVEAMDFIIQTCKFFPTNVYNDMFSDVIGHETYAGTVETAYQNGMITKEMVTDGCFYPTKEITLREFLVSLIHGYSARKPLSSAHPNMIQEAMDMGLIPGDIEKDVPVTRAFAAEICRKVIV